MILVKNKIIPFGRYDAINLFGIIFYKGDKPNQRIINHEAIHTAQMKELLYVGFYVWYVVEWLWKFILYGGANLAYKALSFEREAYINQENLSYLRGRKRYVWLRFLRRKH